MSLYNDDGYCNQSINYTTRKGYEVAMKCCKCKSIFCFYEKNLV